MNTLNFRYRALDWLGWMMIILGLFCLAAQSKTYFLPGLCLLSAGSLLVLSPLIKDIVKFRPSTKECLSLLIIVGVGIWFRLDRLAEFPPAEGVVLDEAISGVRGYTILQGAYEWLQMPMFSMSYPTALVFKLFGMSLDTLRLQFIVSGLITLPIFYLFARTLIGVNPALCALGFFAVCRWHNTVGRIAIDWIHVPLLCSLSMLFFWLGLKRNGRYFIAHGVVWMVCMLSYYALRIIAVIQFLYILILLLRKSASIKGKLLPWLLSSAIFSIPSIGASLKDPSVMAHMKSKYVHLFAFNYNELISFFQDRFVLVARSFWDNDQGQALNTLGWSQIDHLTIVLFCCALIASFLLLSKKQDYNLLVILWFLLPVTTGGMMTDIYHNHRLIILLPLICILAGSAAYYISSQLSQFITKLFSGHWSPQICYCCCSALLLFSAYDNIWRFHQAVQSPYIVEEYQAWRTILCKKIGASQGYVYDASQVGCVQSGDFSWLTPRTRGELVDNVRSLLTTTELQDNFHLALNAFLPDDVSIDEARQILRAKYAHVSEESYFTNDGKLAAVLFSQDSR